MNSLSPFPACPPPFAILVLLGKKIHASLSKLSPKLQFHWWDGCGAETWWKRAGMPQH